MVTIRQYSNGTVLTPELGDVVRFSPAEYSPDSMVWINIQDPDDDELDVVLKQWLCVSDLVMEDVQTSLSEHSSDHWKIHPPKAEEFPNHLFLIYHAVILPEPSSFADASTTLTKIKRTQVNLLLNSGVLVTIHYAALPVIQGLLQRCLGNASLLSRGPDYLSAVIADNVVETLYELNELISLRLVEMERLVMKSASTRTLVRLQQLRQVLLRYRLACSRMSEMMHKLYRGDFVYVDVSEAAYFRDVFDHLGQVLEQIEMFREETNGLVDLHFSMSNSRLNDVMKQLTLISTIFLPVTFVTSWYGMNFVHMPELSLWYAYPGVLIFVVLTALMLYVWFRKRGWIA